VIQLTAVFAQAALARKRRSAAFSCDDSQKQDSTSACALLPKEHTNARLLPIWQNFSHRRATAITTLVGRADVCRNVRLTLHCAGCKGSHAEVRIVCIV
jgi:hypothetical protein